MLKHCGKNVHGQTFWKLELPQEYASVEVGIRADICGIWIGDDYLSWEQIDKARVEAGADR